MDEVGGREGNKSEELLVLARPVPLLTSSLARSGNVTSYLVLQKVMISSSVPGSWPPNCGCAIQQRRCVDPTACREHCPIKRAAMEQATCPCQAGSTQG